VILEQLNSSINIQVVSTKKGILVFLIQNTEQHKDGRV
jgi:hypothetical protein